MLNWESSKIKHITVISVENCKGQITPTCPFGEFYLYLLLTYLVVN